jgi:PhzF family phenazine biosynthesis protein
MKYYVVDAFTDYLFGGNPAGVCLLEGETDPAVMQKIAFENNLSETAFLLQKDGYYDLRWFTPEVEVNLCGHATLGSAFVLMEILDRSLGTVLFSTKSGMLAVHRKNGLLAMDFPARVPVPCDCPSGLEEALGIKLLETHQSPYLLACAESETAVREACPDIAGLKTAVSGPVIITARGTDCDFVSRFFAPNVGIDEDPVTGSAHTTLIPFWSRRLGKAELTARQLSKRGGTLFCRTAESGWKSADGRNCI